MNGFLIIVIIIVICVGIYFAFKYFNKRKFTQMISKNNHKEIDNIGESVSSKNNLVDNNLKAFKEEIIIVNNDGESEEVVLKVLEDNVDIKKIDGNIITIKGNPIYSLKGNIDTFWGDSDDGPIPGNNIFISNSNVIITKMIDDIDNVSNYYINIKNINKITRKNGYYNEFENEEMIAPIAIFTIYTKNNKSLELIYPNDIVIPDKHSPMVIKNSNNSILFEYTFDMCDEKRNIKYEFDDNQLKIGEISCSNQNYIYCDKYEIVIDYFDILDKNIINNDGVLDISIKTKDNKTYFLVFSDCSIAIDFFNELKKH